MRQLLFSISLFCCFFVSQYVHAQDPLSIVQWSQKAEHIQGDEYKLIFTAQIQKGWVVYSMYLPSDEGPVATSLNMEGGKFEALGKAEESTSKAEYKKTGMDETFEMELTKYKHDMRIVQRIKCTDLSAPIEGYINFMTCENMRCLPPTDYDFSIDLSKVKKVTKADNNTETTTTEENNTPTDPEKKEEEKEDKKEEDKNEEDNGNTDQLTPVDWDFKVESLGEDEYKFTFKATIDEGWHIYSQFLEGDEGPIATSINITEDDNVSLVGKATESTSDAKNKIEAREPLFDNMMLIKYKQDFEAVQIVKIKDTTKAIVGFVTYQTCDKEKCLPPTDVDFSFFTSAKKIVDTTDYGAANNINRPQIRQSLAKIQSGESEACGMEESTSNLSFLMIFIFGFIGGLFALLTPCVFPMVPLTVSFFTKRSKSRAEGLRNAILYGLSIIVIYVALGMSITIIFGDNALNWLSTHWVPNVLFFVMFIAFAISFFGYYEIALPSSWSNSSDRQADRGGLIGIFFMAFTLSLVSFSCTGPIIGTLLVQAAEGGRLAPAIGMLGFSSALALPFALFSAFPGWLNSLPRSGGWMNTVKVVLGFIEVALAFKFLSKADLTMHWHLLKYEPFMVIYVLSALAMGIYLLGFIHFPHDSKGAKIGIPRKVLGVGSIALAAYFATGFMVNPKTNTYATPSLMSGLAPPACYSYACPCECPAGIQNCFHDYEKGLAYARSVNKPVMIDFTGHGCENCRKMEDQVWVDKEVNALINDKYVLISLYVDDREKLEKVEKAPDGRKIRTVGNKWAAFERINFEQQSQPLYVLMAPDETVLNAPVGAIFDKKKYQEFLECGLENYAKVAK